MPSKDHGKRTCAKWTSSITKKLIFAKCKCLREFSKTCNFVIKHLGNVDGVNFLKFCRFEFATSRKSILRIIEFFNDICSDFINIRTANIEKVINNFVKRNRKRTWIYFKDSLLSKYIVHFILRYFLITQQMQFARNFHGL